MKLFNIALGLALMFGATQALGTNGWISKANAKVITQASQADLKAEGAKLKLAAEGLSKNPQFIAAVKRNDNAKLKEMISQGCKDCLGFIVAVSPGGGDAKAGLRITIFLTRPIKVVISL